MKKVILVLVDGMRPDSLPACGNPFFHELEAHSSYSMDAQTVMPSVTLPCHMSLFHSVIPERHGILTNTFVPQVRPIRGICEVLQQAGKKCAMFYNWEELKDLSRPESLCYANFISQYTIGYERSNELLTKHAIEFLSGFEAEFTFIYLGWTDEAGHKSGWMSPEYLQSVTQSLDCIQKLSNLLSEDDMLVVTADHGGHNRSHGSNKPEDMTIPLFFYRKNAPSTVLQQANIIDIAPTITAALGVEADHDWEGKNLL